MRPCAFVGAIIAFALALRIFRGQVKADRDLARSERITDAVHEVAGQLTLWAETVMMPRMQDGFSSARREAVFPMVGAETTGALILTLVQRQALLTKAGFQEPVQNLVVTLTAFERAERNLAMTAETLWLKIHWRTEPPDSDPEGRLRTTHAAALVQAAIRDVWIKDFARVVERLSKAANVLAVWTAGDAIPVIERQLGIPELDGMSEPFRKQLTQAGFTVLADNEGLPFSSEGKCWSPCVRPDSASKEVTR